LKTVPSLSESFGRGPYQSEKLVSESLRYLCLEGNENTEKPTAGFTSIMLGNKMVIFTQTKDQHETRSKVLKLPISLHPTDDD
jgi:hypothetical protein